MKAQYITATEVAEIMGISRSKSYQIVRQLNKELKAQGYLTVAGKCPIQYFKQRYRQVLCANSFTNLAELRLHRAEEPALDCPIAEGRVSVKGGEAACEALDASSGFCYQPASSSCSSRCFMLMYFFPPHWVPAT